MRSCGFSIKQQNNTSLEDSIVDDSADQHMVVELERITRGHMQGQAEDVDDDKVGFDNDCSKEEEDGVCGDVDVE